MRSRRWILSAALFGGALGLGGCRFPWQAPSGPQAVELSGTVDAHQVDLSFQAPGRIRRLATDEGEPVATGATVAELDDTDLVLAVQRTTAQARSAHALLAELIAGPRPQEIASARAAVAQAEADRRYADQQVQRTRDLIAEKFVSPDQLDHATSAASMAAARADQARQALSLALAGSRREDIERARADAEAADAAARSARQQLAYARLVSPVAGQVSVRLAERGQVVAVGQPVFRVAELSRPWVRAYLAEQDLPRVRLGQPAEVRVDGLPGKVFHGRLSFVSPQAEFTPKTVETKALRVDLVYRVTVDVDNGDGLLKIGMPADVRLDPPAHP